MKATILASCLISLLMIADAQAAIDQQALEQGQSAFRKICSICHADRPGQTVIGPSLFGVFGRKAGSLAGFNYSEAMKSAGIVWDDDTLDKHLSDPRHFIPGNRMTYAGVKDPALRKDIILYLSTLH
jgi:cytochrome c